MASLTLTVSTFIGTREVSDEVALPKLQLYIERRGGPVNGTNQEKIDWVVNDLVRHIDNTAGELELSESLRVERERVIAEQKDKSWVVEPEEETNGVKP